jgi:tRNA pseudouridine13 synthase
MKIKQQVEDFRVRELLADDVLLPRGEHRVYRVTKRKLTSLEAARILAEQVGASAGDVAMCGLKDRQGLTTQHMSLPRAKSVAIDDAELRISSIGFCARPLSSESSTGNAFEIVVRGLSDDDLATLRANLAVTRRAGFVNYFDDQRFGNLRHNQGWIALDLLRGEHERALRKLLCAASEFESKHTLAFKSALDRAWGDWGACRDIAGRFGQHHSVFEALKKRPDDFAGAFFHVASRLRLIHLYAYQSHVWNRAVAQYVRNHTTAEQRVAVDSGEGPLLYPGADAALPAKYDAQFRLPGPRLGDVSDCEQFDLFADVLALDRLVPAQFAIQGVPGFALKGEDRPLFVEPRHLRLGKPESDALNPPLALVRLRFELPRGAYATLVVRRLLAASHLREPERARDEVRSVAPRAVRRAAPSAPVRTPPDANAPARRPSRRRRPGKDQRQGRDRGAAQS